MILPRAVKIVEVGPRDGLQNIAEQVPTPVKLDLIDRLGAAGLKHIEATSFVSPRWVPQMADHAEIMTGLTRRPGVTYTALAPNEQGARAAIAAGADEIAVFTAASETFCRRNINCSIAESLVRFAPVMAVARDAGIRVRGYVSCAIACPYEGPIGPAKVADIAADMRALGCAEISLGDTIGVGTPDKILALLDAVTARLPVETLALHLHDTYGQAIANIYAGLQAGVTTFDAAIAGLGGCPYAPGASGNVATEDVIYLMNGLGIETGIDLDALVDAALFISAQLGRPPASHVARARAGKC